MPWSSKPRSAKKEKEKKIIIIIIIKIITIKMKTGLHCLDFFC